MKGYWVKQKDGRWFNPITNMTRNDPQKEDEISFDMPPISQEFLDFIAISKEFDQFVLSQQGCKK